MGEPDAPTVFRVNLYRQAMASLSDVASLTEVSQEIVVNRALYAYYLLLQLAEHPGAHATVNLLGDDDHFVVLVFRRRRWHRWFFGRGRKPPMTTVPTPEPEED
jgi:hypothetical protein